MNTVAMILSALGAHAFQAQAPDATAAAQQSWNLLGAGIGLLVLGCILAVCDLFVLAGMSGGILLMVSVVCGLGGCVLAFSSSMLAGWVVLAVFAVLVVLGIRWGLPRLQRSSFVAQAMITQDAGYHHLAEQLGVRAGSTGTLVTDAMPTGRARFASGDGFDELDVVVVGPVLACGANVVVLSVQGATVTVRAAPAPSVPARTIP
jgi:membrane-bound ClpP family serine protease